MATATLSNTPSTISTAESTTGWVASKSYALEPDIKVQGSNSVATLAAASGNNDFYYSGFTAADLSTVHLRLWFNCAFVGYLSSTNPVQAFISDGTNTAYFDWPGGTSYSGGWAQIVIYTGGTVLSGTKPTGNSTRVGVRFNCGTKPRNVPANLWFDAWYYGDGYTVYGGTSGDAIDWSHIATQDKTSAYGILTNTSGVYIGRGAVQIGDGTNTTYFEPNNQILQFADEQVSSTLYDITFFDDASNVTNIDISGGAWAAEGTQRYTIDASTTTINSFSINGTQFTSSDVIDFHANASVTNSVFNNCLQIDPSTSTFENNAISNYVGTEGGALLWPGGTTVKDCSFINNQKSIEITQTSNQTYDNIKFTDEDNTTKQSTHLNNGGTDISISKNNGSNPLYYTATGGGVVSFIGSSTTITLIAQEGDGTKIQSARAYLRANETGSLPYNITVTIANSGTTATVTHTAHGLSTGDKVVISGASLTANLGVFSITVTGVNAYTYTMASTPGSSPTGTIKCSFVYIEGLTDVNGEIEASRVYPSDQASIGTIRKSSADPFYKPAPLSGDVSSTLDTTFIGTMISDD